MSIFLLFFAEGVKLNYILSQVGDLLVIMVTLDCLVHCSPLQSHWAEYRKMVKSLSRNSSKCQKSPESLKSIEIVLNNIEDTILSDKIFYNSYHSLQKIKTSLDKKSLLAAEDYVLYLKKCTVDLERASTDYYESLNSLQWVKVNALFVFYYHIFGNVDKKLFRSLFDVNVKVFTMNFSNVICIFY